MKCPHCQTENPSPAKFCLECGASFNRFRRSDPRSMSDDLERALSEALDQQAATAEILGIISDSPADAQPVFDAIAVNALRLCDARGAVVVRYDGELLHVVAHHNVNPEAVDLLKRQYPLAPDRQLPIGRAVLDGAVVQVTDLQTVEFSGTVARQFGARGHVSIPLLHGGRAIGAIGISRPTLGPFSDRQVALLQTFAAQAVIAIENVRLFNQLQEKNRALTAAHAQVSESLQQQTATADILRVISGAHTDTQPVFEAIVQSAARLCNAGHATVLRTDGTTLYLLANYGSSPELLARARALFPRPLDTTTTAGTAILTRSVVQVPDSEDASASEFVRQGGRLLGYRSSLAVPMLRGSEAIGAIRVTRREPSRFSDADVELLRTFADQAVIAIENVRLFKELETRNRDLTVALDQQTATSEVLRVISSSPTDVQPVFEAIVRSASRLCDGEAALATRFDGESIHLAAQYNLRPGTEDILPRLFPRPPGREMAAGRAIMTRAVVHIPDVRTDPDYDPEVARPRGCGACWWFRCCARVCPSAPSACRGRGLERFLTVRSSS